MANIQVRVDDDLKIKSDALFKDLGTDTTTAIRMFLTQALAVNGFPFEIKRVNPYKALTEPEILAKLEKSREHAAQGMFKDATEVSRDMRTKYGHIFYRFSDVHTHYLLKELKHTLPMQMIFSPCYTVLKQYDKEHNTDLCYVFMQYLTHGRNINQTSTAIFLHRNTVMNKVKKAISVMHNEFEDTQTLMAFILSYLNDHM